MDWRAKLTRLVQFYATQPDRVRQEEPFYLWVVDQAVPFEWPPALPVAPSLRQFYEICGGGEFGPMMRFIPASQLAERTQSWIETLRNYDHRGDILVPARHLVFANDADGTPWILDASTGEVASFYWKGGDWEEPRFRSHDEFMEHIFVPEKDDPDWAAALEAILGSDPDQARG